MSSRGWISLITVLLVGLVVYFARGELVQTWELLSRVNLWILALLIPAQVFAYYAAGEMFFSYLRAKGSIKNISRGEQARMALELNFVNHVLPSAGISGVSYMTWRLGDYGVSPSRSAMAQVVRYAMNMAAYALLLALSVLVVTIDGTVNRWIILISSGMVTGFILTAIGGIYLLSSADRLQRFSIWVTPTINRLVRKLTFNRVKKVLNLDSVTRFFSELSRDYDALRRDLKLLRQPFRWGVIYTLFDLGMFLITFWALGTPINPALVFIAYGLATVAGIVSMTPGGTGLYEAIMVTFLAIAGLNSGVAIAGIVLTRVITLAGTIVMGYVFYQQAILRHGRKHP